MSGGLLGETVQAVDASREDMEISETFMYFGSVVCSTGESCQKVFQQSGLGHGIMDLLNMSTWWC